MENNILLSILLVIVGLIIGAGIVFIINLIKKNNAKDKAKNLIEEAQKESERIKKDLIFEVLSPALSSSRDSLSYKAVMPLLLSFFLLMLNSFLQFLSTPYAHKISHP